MIKPLPVNCSCSAEEGRQTRALTSPIALPAEQGGDDEYLDLHPRSTSGRRRLSLVPSFVVSMAFLLIADIDAPRRRRCTRKRELLSESRMREICLSGSMGHGLIDISAQNLENLAKSLGH